MKDFHSLKDYVYDYIAEQIRENNLKAEEKISEAVICTALDISRTPVREALIQLSTEGFIDYLPRKGFSVKKFSVIEAEETYEIIGVLEGLAAKLALNNVTEKELKNMEYYLDAMDLAIEKENYDIYHKEQMEFHNTYIYLCENKSLISLLEQTRKKFFKRRYVNQDGNQVKEIFKNTNREHREILRLIKEENPDALELYIKNVHWHPRNASLETL